MAASGYSLVCSRLVDAGSLILACKLSAEISRALVDIETTCRPFPALRTLASECVEHVEACAAVLTWIALAVILGEAVGEIRNSILERYNSPLQCHDTSSITHARAAAAGRICC